MTKEKIYWEQMKITQKSNNKNSNNDSDLKNVEQDIPDKSLIDKYLHRPNKFINLNLITFTKSIVIKNNRYTTATTEFVVRTFPICKRSGDDVLDEAYYQQLCILHITGYIFYHG